MPDYTTPHGISFPVSADRIKDQGTVAKLALDISSTARTANDALTVEGARAEESAYQRARWKRGFIPGNVDVREYLQGVGEEGQYACINTDTVASQTGLPDDLMKNHAQYVVVLATMVTGVALKLTTYSVWGIDEYVCSSAPVTAGWTRWEKTKFAGYDETSKAGAAYGYKTAALTLTSPSGASNVETVSALSMRHAMEYGTGFKRFRVHIRNFNDRSGAALPGAANFTGLWFGEGNKANGSFKDAPTRLSNSFSTPDDGSEYVSPWFNAEVKAGAFYLLSMGVTASSISAVRSFASVWRLNGSSAGGPTQNISWELGSYAPFDIWVEAEVPADTPIIGEVGSSSAVGSKATYPILESPLSIYCRSVGALPMHYTHSGSTLAIWEDSEAAKWQKFQDCARPDAMVLSLGSNDLFGTRTLAEIQESAASIVGIIKAMATDNIYATTIEPRTSGDETKRRQYNSWLKTKPLGIRDVFERAASISNDDDTIRPEYDADGIHTNTAGNLAKANAFTRPMFQALLKIQETAGRTVSVWDYLNQREQMIYGDTGLRDISSLILDRTAGSAFVRRENNTITVYLNSVVSSRPGAGVSIIASLGSGYRADNASEVWTIASNVSSARRVGVNIYGQLTTRDGDSSYPITAVFTFTTRDPWPNSLLGVAA